MYACKLLKNTEVYNLKPESLFKEQQQPPHPKESLRLFVVNSSRLVNTYTYTQTNVITIIMLLSVGFCLLVCVLLHNISHPSF